ncbi:DUF3575 domain-containing protein [Sphingobacterium lumbrici]|uniref:DUF3575 domain-containing protein n=1 Tax=Sphingobacterium lumbrici TaxID=2559600 RepID=UPI00112B1624|nr:DUF3575 domain-containing protein [Sphingobacterium lumbrici]
MKNQILKLVPLLGLLLVLSNSQAQTIPSTENESLNMVKFNAMSLFGGKFSFEYERMLTNRIAAAAAISIRPNKGLPFRSTIKNFADDEELNQLIDEFSSSNFSITPEVRFYTSKRGPFRGFYIAPYVKYASYGASLPLDFDIEETGIYSRTETIPLKGDLTSFTAGVSCGVNFKLSRNIHLDWRIMGPGYGSAKGSVSGKMALDADEQSALRESLADLKTDMEDLPLSVKIDYDVNADGANIKVLRSPWAGIRSGLSIAYRF